MKYIALLWISSLLLFRTAFVGRTISILTGLFRISLQNAVLGSGMISQRAEVVQKSIQGSEYLNDELKKERFLLMICSFYRNPNAVIMPTIVRLKCLCLMIKSIFCQKLINNQNLIGFI